VINILQLVAHQSVGALVDLVRVGAVVARPALRPVLVQHDLLHDIEAVEDDGLEPLAPILLADALAVGVGRVEMSHLRHARLARGGQAGHVGDAEQALVRVEHDRLRRGQRQTRLPDAERTVQDDGEPLRAGGDGFRFHALLDGLTR
jgi:hypothetical protein